MNNNPYEEEGSYDEISVPSSEEERSYCISRSRSRGDSSSFSSAPKYDEGMSEEFDQLFDNNSAPSASLNNTIEYEIAFDNVDKDFCDEKGWSTGRGSSSSSFSNAQTGFERSNSNDFFEQEENSLVDRQNFGSFNLFSNENSEQSIRSQKQSVLNQKETNNVHSESPSVEKEEDSNSNSIIIRSKPTSRRRSQRTISSQSPRHSASVSKSSSVRSMISKETTNSIGYQATDASSKSSTVSRPTSRNITAEADPSNKNKSHISGTQVSRYTASSRPSEPTIPPFQKSSKSEQHSQKMSSNRIHGYQRSHSHQTNSVTSGGSKQTRSNPKKKVETNHDSTLNPVRSHTKDTSVTSPTKRKSRRRRNQAKSKPSSSEVRHDHDQSIPTISEDHVLSHTSIKSSQRKSRTLPSPRTSETTTTTTTKNIDENEHVVKKLPMTSFQAGKAHDTRNALYFSQSISLLNNYDCGLKMEMKHIHATINNEGFQNLVRKAFNRLVEVRPRLIYLLSPEEWLHIHILILYARIFDCELHFHRIVLPPEFQIKIPENIQIFEPIVAILSSIGIVDDIDMGVTYIPVAKPYRGDADVHYKPHDKDDVTEFLEWAQYDWLKSWDQVKKGRLERKRMAAENNIKIPQNDGIAQGQCDDDDVMKLTEWEQLALEKWLGWDDELWSSYKQACYVLSRIANFVTNRR